MLGWLIALLLALVASFYLLSGLDTSNIGGGQVIYIVGAGALVLLYLSSMADDYRGRAGTALRHAAIWLGAGFAVLALYAFRGEIGHVVHRVAGEVVPPGVGIEIETAEQGERAVRIRRQTNGHFSVRGTVNGQVMTLLVDTGASTVVLKPADADRAGIDTSGLSYTVAVSTANGQAYAAPARIRSISVGQIEVRDVEALVAKPGTLNESLLGMSFLRRLRSYEFSGEFLTLRGGSP